MRRMPTNKEIEELKQNQASHYSLPLYTLESDVLFIRVDDTRAEETWLDTTGEAWYRGYYDIGPSQRLFYLNKANYVYNDIEVGEHYGGDRVDIFIFGSFLEGSLTSVIPQSIKVEWYHKTDEEWYEASWDDVDFNWYIPSNSLHDASLDLRITIPEGLYWEAIV